MPSHGRGLALPRLQRLRQRPGLWDLPELPHRRPADQRGRRRRSGQAAAAIGVQRAWYGVNGATGMLQAALLALAAPGQAVLLPRNSRAVFCRPICGRSHPLLFDLPFR